MPIEIDVTEHSGSTIVTQVIELFGVRTRKVQKRGAAFLYWEFGTFALACYDCIVHKLKVHWTCCYHEKRETMSKKQNILLKKSVASPQKMRKGVIRES